jgi:hypothetical protein
MGFGRDQNLRTNWGTNPELRKQLWNTYIQAVEEICMTDTDPICHQTNLPCNIKLIQLHIMFIVSTQIQPTTQLN